MFTTKLLLNNLDLFLTPPSQIHYCYGVWQDGFQPMKKQGVKFHEGVPDTDQLKTWFPKGGLLVLDDLMAEGGNDKRVLDLFTKHSHHQNVLLVPRHVSAGEICQDYFQKRPLHRCLQESTRSIKHEKFIVTGVSHSMASFARHVSTFDRTSVWIHGLGFTSWQFGRSKDSQPSFKGRRMYAMSQIHRDVVMSPSQDSITTVSLRNGFKKSAQLVNKDLLYRLDGLFPFTIVSGGVIARCFSTLSGAMVV